MKDWPLNAKAAKTIFFGYPQAEIASDRSLAFHLRLTSRDVVMS